MEDSAPPRLGKYELLARIATGGMAEIFLARQPGPGSFSRLVVVKRILPHLAERRQFLDMFLEEARLASLVRHQNVVQIFDVGQDEATYFIAMEYIDGLSVGALARRARKGGALLPPSIAGEIIAQACDGLHAAHELRDEDGRHLGLVHRDVSPHNLMVASCGTVKLVDFGIAKAQGSDVRTRTGALKGKFPYMSPEQCRGEHLDRRSDLFSLASVFIELLVGKRVFDRASDLMTLKAITEEPLPEAHTLRPDVPPSMSDVILRAHAREPEGRFATAAEMGAAIRGALEVEGQETGPATLERYLREECASLLESREQSVRRLREITRSDMSVPKISGFDDGTSGSGSLKTRPDRVSSLPEPEAKPRRGGRILVVLLLALGVSALATVGAILALRPPPEPTRPEGAPLRFGCPPYYPAKTVEEGLRPLADFLEGRLDRPVDVVVGEDYDSTVEAVIAGRVDLANVSPLLLVELRAREPRVEILASHTYEGARTYQSLIVARDDAGITAPEQLRGRSFCYVDRGSTSGYLVPRHFLRSRGLDPETLFARTKLSGTHLAVMRDVVAGECDAGAIFSGALLGAQGLDVATSRLQIVANAGQTPWDVVVASPLLQPAVRDAVRRTLFAFEPRRDLGRPYVSETFKIDGFVEPRMEDFAAVQAAAEAEGLIPARPSAEGEADGELGPPEDAPHDADLP